MGKFISQKEVKNKYGISSQVLYSWRKNGKVIFKEDDKVMYDEDTILSNIKPKKSKKESKGDIKYNNTPKNTIIEDPIITEDPIIEDQTIPSNDYIPGLDSNYILKGGFKSSFKSRPLIHLDLFNKEHNTSAKDWDEVSNTQLTEKQLDKYAEFINWYRVLCNSKEREFSESFMKKYKSKFILRKLDLLR